MAPSSRGRITGRTTSSGSKVKGIPRHRAPASGLAAPRPRLIPSIPFAQEKTQEADGENTHQVLLGVFTEAGRREGVTWGGGDCGYKADDRLQNGPCTHPNPRTGGRAAGAQEDGLGKDSKGRSPWAGGLRGL